MRVRTQRDVTSKNAHLLSDINELHAAPSCFSVSCSAISFLPEWEGAGQGGFGGGGGGGGGGVGEVFYFAVPLYDLDW